MVSVKRREIEPRPTRQRPVWPDWAFLNILATKFPAKMPQKFAKHFGLFWKMAFLNKNCGGYLFSNFWWKLGYFLLQHLVTLGPPNTAAKSFPFSTKNCKTECLLTVSERAKGKTIVIFYGRKVVKYDMNFCPARASGKEAQTFLLSWFFPMPRHQLTIWKAILILFGQGIPVL